MHTRGSNGNTSDEMLSQVIKALLERNLFDTSEIDDIIVGCAYPEGEQGYNIGRLATFLGELLVVSSTTINGCAASPCKQSWSPLLAFIRMGSASYVLV